MVDLAPLIRSAGSRTPTVTVSRTRSRAPPTGTGSVTASVARITALSDVDRRRQLATDFETGRKLLELERHAESALDRLLARDRHPQHHGTGERKQLECEVAKRPDPHHDDLTCTRRPVWRRP